MLQQEIIKNQEAIKRKRFSTIVNNKARVAPILQSWEERNKDDSQPGEEGERDSTRPLDFDKMFVQKNTAEQSWYGVVNLATIDKAKGQVHQRWRTLTNTVRSMNVVKKAFESINDDLIKDKQRASKVANLSSQCLLENRLSNELAKVRQFIQSKSSSKTEREQEHERDQWLIRYFIDLSDLSDGTDKTIDFDLIEDKLLEGLDINCVDKHGQCALHEVARIWHVDVARFLLSHGARINLPDKHGRTPLHVACAVDYPEMVEFLLQMGADIMARTFEESQTPIHYAAQNDAAESLTVLLKNGANMNDLDYKQRTPLQIAAELDRSTTAELLIEEGAPAGVYDDSKLAALVVMIRKMPSVALKALDQFYTTSRANRKQYFYLNFLVPPIEDESCFAKSPLQVAVEYKQYQLLLHPVFQRLIEVKWQRIGKWGAWFYGIMNLLMCLLWTTRLCLIPMKVEETYQGDRLPVSILLDCLAVLSLIFIFVSETKEYFKAKRTTQRYKEWREEQLQRDLKYAHPRWPEERAYLEREIRSSEEYTSSYIKDKWNYLDWSTQFLMITTVVLHVCNMMISTRSTNDYFRMVASLTLLSMWIRLLKYARPFKAVGLFVVMLSHVVTDTLKILFLCLHIFVPYIAAFWMVFGVYNIKGYTMKNGELLYHLFQIGVVGDYNKDQLEAHSALQYQLLVGTFVFLGGIVCLNLFIALLSDTFQRVYDNAKATAEMQRAASILEMEAALSARRQRKQNNWITKHCAPETQYYDDDVFEEDSTALKKMTHQIRARVDEVHSFLESNNTGNRHSQNRQSQASVRTTEEQLSTSRSGSNDTKFLVDSLNELKADFYKSTIQTRAEIAGLGLMLKDLIDENATLRAKKKRNMIKLPAVSRNIKPLSEAPSTNEGVGLIDSQSIPREENLGSSEIPKVTGNERKEKNISQKAMKGAFGIPENDFYEGYTFGTQSQANDDQLIKRTWGTIFTKMMEKNENRERNIGEEEEEVEEAGPSIGTPQISESKDCFLTISKKGDLNPNASFNI